MTTLLTTSESSPSATSKTKLIIFDFDGVLADSFDNFYLFIRDAMKHVGLFLAPDEYRNFFIGNVHQGFIDFINDKKKYSAFSKFRKSNYDKYYTAKLFPGASEVLRALEKKYILTIASSGQQSNIISLLKKNSIRNLFGLILADSKTTKENMVREILDKYKEVTQDAVMITDTCGDVSMAKKLGLKTIAVTWGFHSRSTLVKARANKIANNFKSLEKFLS